MVSRGTLSAGHARPLLALPLDAAKIRVARKIEKLGLSVREAEALVRRESAAPTKPQVREPAPHVVQMEETLSMSLGTKVNIQQKRKGGRLVIHFRTNEDFERLYETLTGHETIEEDL
jgi:ParB family chromosome partitioning protein